MPVRIISTRDFAAWVTIISFLYPRWSKNKQNRKKKDGKTEKRRQKNKLGRQTIQRIKDRETNSRENNEDRKLIHRQKNKTEKEAKKQKQKQRQRSKDRETKTEKYHRLKQHRQTKTKRTQRNKQRQRNKDRDKKTETKTEKNDYILTYMHAWIHAYMHINIHIPNSSCSTGRKIVRAYANHLRCLVSR